MTFSVILKIYCKKYLTKCRKYAILSQDGKAIAPVRKQNALSRVTSSVRAEGLVLMKSGNLSLLYTSTRQGATSCGEFSTER